MTTETIRALHMLVSYVKQSEILVNHSNIVIYLIVTDVIAMNNEKVISIMDVIKYFLSSSLWLHWQLRNVII